MIIITHIRLIEIFLFRHQISNNCYIYLFIDEITHFCMLIYYPLWDDVWGSIVVGLNNWVRVTQLRRCSCILPSFSSFLVLRLFTSQPIIHTCDSKVCQTVIKKYPVNTSQNLSTMVQNTF